MKYEYCIQQKWNGSRRWESTDMHFGSIKEAKNTLKTHKENSKYYKSRIAKRAVGKWEIVMKGR